MAFTRLRGFFIGVWSITLLVDNLLVVFLFLEGAWSDKFNLFFLWLLIFFPLWTPWGSCVSVVTGAVLVAPILVTAPHLFAPLVWGASFVRSLFSVPSRILIHCLLPLQRFQPHFLGGAPYWRVSGVPYSCRTGWRVQGACRTHQVWFSLRSYFFWSSDWIRRLEVLSNSRPPYLRLAYVSDTDIALRQRRRRG